MIDKIEQSKKLICQLYSKTQPNIIAFSGGKDSIVLYDLAMKSGLDFEYIYSNTTIDPPGHLKFIRDNFPNVKIQQPKRSFYKLVQDRALPMRQTRFCCKYLKEYVGKGCKTFEGLRINEGKDRGKRLRALKEPEQCDTRVKGKIHAYPIMNWTKKEIWDYINENNLPYSKHYDLGFDRLGCIGCPMAKQTERIRQYKMYPRYVYALIKAIDKNIKRGGRISKMFNDPYEAFYWWISGLSIKEHKELTLFEIDYKAIILKTFPLKSRYV